MSALTAAAADALRMPPRRAAAPSRVESALAEVLAEVLQRPRDDAELLEAHFFDRLGADSLVMARFCARLRKRGDLPPVSMKDVYAHPTLRRLAAALAQGRPAAAPPSDADARPTPTHAREHVMCGALQVLFYFAYTWLGVFAAVEGYQALVAGAQGAGRIVLWVLFGAAAFLVVCLVPIAAKWLLIGRWRPQQIRLWSLGYLRFWIVKSLIRSNPAAYLFVGSPLYGLYLRALGAKIGPRVVILSRNLPVCTDLLAIGAGSVIRREALFPCYRAHAGRIETGPVTLGRAVLVGERSVLDIGTSMGDGAQLGHASALASGQTVPAGQRWHGCPAQRTDVDYLRIPPAPCGPARRTAYAALTLLGLLLLYVPLVEGGVALLALAVPSLAIGSGAVTLSAHDLVVGALAGSALLFFGTLFAGLIAVGVLPRLLGRCLEPDRVYPLYSGRYALHRIVAALGRTRFFAVLFGDSSYIVPFLNWTGWRLQPVVQTGSNFGSEVTTTHPPLTAVGPGTMVADGLHVINDEVSSSSFRVSRAVIGPRNFIGNDVVFPAGGATGDNCLLAIKAMVPLDGVRREGVGLLGAPPFEIPRSVERDSRFDALRSGEALQRALAAKDRFNLRTIGLFLGTRWFGVFLALVIDLAAIEWFADRYAHAAMAALFTLSAVAAAVYYALVERAFIALGPPPPDICSIYDPRFWWVERLWKLHPINFLHLFDGTPFKSLLWRLVGVRMGARVFDDGVHISEPTLTTIGDECVLNQRSKIQCESQEDGTYKSGPSVLGKRCTLGVGAFVHYGATMGDGAVLGTDSFLMKGEEVPPRAHWVGNPAREGA